jgi:hypothetical protein
MWRVFRTFLAASAIAAAGCNDADHDVLDDRIDATARAEAEDMVDDAAPEVAAVIGSSDPATVTAAFRIERGDEVPIDATIGDGWVTLISGIEDDPITVVVPLPAPAGTPAGVRYLGRSQTISLAADFFVGSTP